MALPAPVVLTLTGTAASGSAIGGGTIEAKCIVGEASSLTGADGAFTLPVADGKLPCLLRVASSKGDTLHSVANGDSTAVRANVTPVSELIVASMTFRKPADAFAEFSASFDTGRLSKAKTSVMTFLSAAGIDVSEVGDPLTGPLAAATANSPGDAFDRALESLQTRLTAAGTELQALAMALARSAPDAPASAISNVPSLPPDLLLRRTSASCPALREGRYRFVLLRHSWEGIGSIEDVGAIFDPVSDTFRAVNVFEDGRVEIQADGESDFSSVLTPNGKCSFTDKKGGPVLVSDAGIVVWTGEWAYGFPEQKQDVATLAGDWNLLGFSPFQPGEWGPISPEDGGFVGKATINEGGFLEKVDYCGTGSSCLSLVLGTAEMPFLRARASGGFELRDPSDGDGTSPTDMLFAYRAGGGGLMLLHVDVHGEFAFWTRSRVLALPQVGATRQRWSIRVLPDSQWFLSEFSESVTALGLDGAGFVQQWVRGDAAWSWQILINQPQTGFSIRPEQTVTTSDGSEARLPSFTALDLQSMGVEVRGQWMAEPRMFFYSVLIDKPVP